MYIANANLVVVYLLSSFTYLTCRVCTVTEEGSTIFERDLNNNERDRDGSK